MAKWPLDGLAYERLHALAAYLEHVVEDDEFSWEEDWDEDGRPLSVEMHTVMLFAPELLRRFTPQNGVLTGGGKPDWFTARNAARDALGMSDRQADRLFLPQAWDLDARKRTDVVAYLRWVASTGGVCPFSAEGAGAIKDDEDNWRSAHW